MSIKIYNSLTRKKEDFVSIEPKKVKIYACGVTVYDDCHIGHARSLLIFEIIRRYFKYKGYEVTFVRNITDIEDKIIAKADKLGVSAKELSEKYISSYYNDLEYLGIPKADLEPKATEHIAEMIEAIGILIKNGYAYAAGSDVYFNIEKFKNYGRLSNQNLDQMRSSVRIEQDRRKKNPLDFALWKTAKINEPKWPSPWGQGRPGWHIECSVMSAKYLGETFDIHGGGRDLIFPHHENEIAQSEALNGKAFVKYWMHHGLVTINSQKMAKSLGNSLTIKDAFSRYHPNALKLLFLSSHYSSSVDFTEDKIQEFDKARKKIDMFYDRLAFYLPSLNSTDRGNLTSWAKEIRREIKKTRQAFEDAMDDDFNTANALAVLFGFLDKTSEFLSLNDDQRRTAFGLSAFLVAELCNCLCLSVNNTRADIDEGYISKKIEERNKAKEAGDFKKADKIRGELEEEGIILEDTKDKKTIYRRK